MKSIRLIRAAAAALVGYTLLTACSSQSVEAPLVSTSASTASSVAYLDQALSGLPGRIQELMDETGVPGLSVAVVANGETVYSAGFGTANLDTGAAVDADTVFQLASVSKPVGATVIAQQAGQGTVEWSSRVVESEPDFALRDPWVTEHLQIADLYAHRSGLPDHAGDDLEWLGFSRDEILRQLRYLPLSDFRDSYAYTNYGIQAGALAVASAAGTDWMTLSTKAIYEPVGMTRTTSSYDEYIAMENHAVGHVESDGVWKVWPEPFNDDAASAAGGVASSANDMARWLAMVLGHGTVDGKEVIPAGALVPALTPHNLSSQPRTADKPPGQYGYGFGVSVNKAGNTVVSHSGAFSQGAATLVAMVPATGLGVVVLTNGFPVGLAETVGMEFLDEAQFGEQTFPWWEEYSKSFASVVQPAGKLTGATPPADAVPAGPPSQYVGIYRNQYYGDAVVSVEGDALRLHLGPEAGGRTWTLEHWDGDVFRMLLGMPEFTEDSTSAVTFDPTKGTLDIEFYQGAGVGNFQR